jgi:hypothetical protein
MMERTYTALFCEDIRREMGKKITLVGILGSSIVLPPKPTDAPDKVATVIPKLCVYFRFQFDVQDRFERLQFKVTLPPHEEMPASYDDGGLRDISSKEIESARQAAQRKGVEIARLVSLIEMWPFPIFGPSEYKAEIIVDGQSHLCGILRFTNEKSSQDKNEKKA